MKLNLINRPVTKEVDGKLKTFDRFFLVADNGIEIAIDAGRGHSKKDETMNKQIWARNAERLRIFADKVDA